MKVLTASSASLPVPAVKLTVGSISKGDVGVRMGEPVWASMGDVGVRMGEPVWALMGDVGVRMGEPVWVSMGDVGVRMGEPVWASMGDVGVRMGEPVWCPWVTLACAWGSRVCVHRGALHDVACHLLQFGVAAESSLYNPITSLRITTGRPATLALLPPMGPFCDWRLAVLVVQVEWSDLSTAMQGASL